MKRNPLGMPSNQDEGLVGPPSPPPSEALLGAPLRDAPERVFDAEPYREKTRVLLAAAFAIIYLLLGACVVAYALTTTWDGSAQGRITTIASSLLAPMAGLLGPIIGFYFAEMRNR
jgi:hypothetical protein